MQIILPPSKKIALKVENFESIVPEMKEMINFLQKKKYIIPGSRLSTAFALAQPQISKSPLRYFVLNTDYKNLLKEFGGVAIVNPKIVSKNKETRYTDLEGCLSYPFRPMIKVKRCNEIVVSYDIMTIKNDYSGKPGLAVGLIENKTLTGLTARIFLHEFEHLNGKSIFDK